MTNVWMLATTLMTVGGAIGQVSFTPQFEAASIKLNPSMALRHVLLPPKGGRLSTRNAPLRLLIQNAYHVQTFQVSGGPEWMNSAGYDLEAKAEGNPSQSQIWLMLQSLLEDRFKLKVHRETKELPVYALTAAKNGLKLPKPKEGDCTPSPCGNATVAFETATGLSVQAGQVAMAEFIKVLSNIIERPIVDRTGFTEKFDVHLGFAYDEATGGLPNPRRAGDSGQPAELESSPSIMIALQQQLGLKLEASKGPVEILVIDHVERPSEN
jgi:uncharacterized protein (TIGR03435 family)